MMWDAVGKWWLLDSHGLDQHTESISKYMSAFNGTVFNFSVSRSGGLFLIFHAH